MVDLGSGKGYLSDALALGYSLRVLGIDSAASNTSGAISRHALVTRLMNLKRYGDMASWPPSSAVDGGGGGGGGGAGGGRGGGPAGHAMSPAAGAEHGPPCTEGDAESKRRCRPGAAHAGQRGDVDGGLGAGGGGGQGQREGSGGHVLRGCQGGGHTSEPGPSDELGREEDLGKSLVIFFQFCCYIVCI